MAYPEKLINPNEEVVLDLRPHWWFFYKHIFSGLVLIGLLVLTMVLSGTPKKILAWVVLILAIVWAIWLLIKFISWSRTYFVVTSKRVIYRTGVLSRHGVEIPMDRITNLNFHQRIFERVIGAGTLDVQSAGEEGTTMFENVRHPDGVQQEIYSQMEGNTQSGSAGQASAIGKAVAEAMGSQSSAGQDVATQIERLAELRDKGHITAAEYEAKKSELLGKM